MHKKVSKSNESDYARQTPRGKSPARREISNTSYLPSQRTTTNGASSSMSSSSRQQATREKTSSKLTLNAENEKTFNSGNSNNSSGSNRATSVIKSNMKQRRALARERWNMLKHVRRN